MTDEAPKSAVRRLPMLLLEPDPLLRRTVALTARSLGLGPICEAPSYATARRMISARKFGGAVLSLEYGDKKYHQYDLTLIDQLRLQSREDAQAIPIAVMVAHCEPALAAEFRERGVSRIILKPFRARTLLDTFAQFLSPPA